MHSASNDLYCTPSQVTYGMLNFFVSFFGLHPILCFLAIFTNILFFLNFYLDFLFFFVTVFFLFAEHGFLPDFVFGRVTSLICWRVDLHCELVPALESAEEIIFLFTIIVLV